MISLVAQERLLGFALGSGLVGAAVLEQRRAIHRSMTPQSPPAGSVEPVRRRRPDDIEMAHIWNRAVDRALAPLIAALSSRGW
ncbi:zinc finger, C3HC4 type family protein [Wolffia australiana]